MNHQIAYEILARALGSPVRTTEKIVEWRTGGIGLVLQRDQPKRELAAHIWLPYPQDGQSIPEFAFEYPAEAGRHSNTYAAKGLEKGSPALKLVVRTEGEVNGTIAYAQAMGLKTVLPTLQSDQVPNGTDDPVSLIFGMPPVVEPKKRREAISRLVQREVWQRDGGRCVECETREKLCFDHIVPYSRGGSNTVRNIQLLCERCNLSKGNRI